MIAHNRSLRALSVICLVIGILASTVSPAFSSSWTVAKFLDFPSSMVIFPDVVSSPSGDFYMAYHTGSPLAEELKILKWNGTSWTLLHTLTPSTPGINTTDFAEYLWLVVRADNDIHLAFHGYTGSGLSSQRGVHYGHYNGSAWTFDNVEVNSDPQGRINVQYYNMTVDAANRPHIAISVANANEPRSSKLIHAVKSGAWIKTTVETTSIDQYKIEYPTITTDAAGHAYIAYEDSSVTPNQMVLQSNASGAWVRSTLFPEPLNTLLAPYDLRADASGSLHLTYAVYSAGVATGYYGTNAGGSWVFSPVPGSTGNEEAPRLTINDNGVKLLTYLSHDSSGTERVKAAFQRPGGNWQVEQADSATEIDYFLACALNNNNQVMVVNERPAGAWYATTTITLTEITSVSVPANGLYGVGQALNFSVNYNEPVTVNTTGGTPSLPVTFNTGGTVAAAYLSGSGTSTLTFRYTIASGQLDPDGIILGSSLALNGGTIKNSSGSDVSLALAGVPSTTGIKVDGVAPAAPVVTSPANGSRINVNRPTIAGTAEAGSTVNIYINSVFAGNSTVNASGVWSLTPAVPLSDAAHTVSATATDAVGNTGPASPTITFTVDTTPPMPPVLQNPVNGSIIGDNTPTLSGTAEAGSTVTIYVDGGAVVTTTADGANIWSSTLGTPLTDGPHSARTTAADAAGNISPSSNTNSFTVDTTPPAAPVIVTPADGSAAGDNTPAFSGTAEANSTVAVYLDGALAGSTTVNGSGSWSLTPTAALPDGSHTARATAADAVGNTSGLSSAKTFTVDTLPPAAPVITGPADSSITNDNTPTVSGTAEAGSTVTLYLDGSTAGTTTAAGTGSWTWTSTTPLSDGPHTVQAAATDAVGNMGALSTAKSFTVDTIAPVAPVVINPANGSSTSDSTPMVSGTAEANSTVTVRIDGMAVGTTTADASGSWSFTPFAALSNGQHPVYATATDAAGNLSPASNTNTVTIDTVMPASPQLIAPAAGLFTNDNTPTFSGTAEAGSTVTIYLDGSAAGTTTASSSGSWSWTPSTPLSDDAYTTRATATDAVGNTGLASPSITFTVDTLPPAAPVVQTPASGSATNDNTPTVSGTAEASSTVTVLLDGSSVATVTASGAGSWTWTPASALADGAHIVSAAATDGAGNIGAASLASTFTIDTHAPTISLSTTATNLTNSAVIPVVVTFSEPVSDLAIGDISAENGTVSGLAGSGLLGYTFNLTAAGQGAVKASILAGAVHDAAGNTSLVSNDLKVTYDSLPPSLVSITRADGSPTNASVVHFNVSFSEAVTGLNTADFALTASGLAGSSIQNLTGSGSAYTLAVSTGSGSGTLRLDLTLGNLVADSAANRLATSGAGWQDGRFTGGEAYVVDHTPPVVERLTAGLLPRSGSDRYTFTVRFRDDQGIDPAQFGDENIRLRGTGFDCFARRAKTVEISAGKVYEVTYEVDSPLDGWESLPNEGYDLILQANQVRDLNGSAMDQQVLGSIQKEQYIYLMVFIGKN